MKLLIMLLIAFIAGISCAQVYLVPDLPQRALLIDTAKPGLYYPYVDCSSHFLGVCSGKQHKVDSYDLNDPLVRQKLHDMNFLCRVADKH